MPVPAHSTAVEAIRQSIDPEGKLPYVTMVPDPEVTIPRGTLIPAPQLIQQDGETVGRVAYVRDTRHHEAWFNGIRIDESQRGRGLATAAYLAALDRAFTDGDTFRTHDWTQTERTVAIWNKFVTAKIAETVEPFEYSHTEKNGAQKFTGYYRITPPKK